MKPAILAWKACGVLAWLLLCFGCSKENSVVASGEGPGATNAPMTIVPQEAVGPIHAGMTVDEVQRMFGPPQLTTANALEYKKLGFAVMPRSGPVQAVLCGDVTGINGPLVNRFNGHTKEGIGLKSTRQEIIRAYGDPTETHTYLGGTESMLYANLGMTFTLEGGKVYHMIIRLTGEQEPERTLSVDLAPPAKK